MTGISLQTYQHTAQSDPNARLSLGMHNDVRTSGRRNIGNLFTRAWDCLTRSNTQVQSNKAITQDFIRALSEKYGDEIARMAASSLSTHESKGRPLTGYRIERVLEKAESLKNRVHNENTQLLESCLENLARTALEKLGYNNPSNEELSDTMQRVSDAIRQSSRFQEHAFMKPDYHMMNSLDDMGMTNDNDSGTALAQKDFFSNFIRLAVDTVLDMESEQD